MELENASGTFANYTHIFVSFLKAWMVTVQGIDCYNAAFYCHFKKAHTRNRSFKKKNFFFSKFCKEVGKLDYS